METCNSYQLSMSARMHGACIYDLALVRSSPYWLILGTVLQVIGDEDLAAKFEESALTIRRDIIFAASLYI